MTAPERPPIQHIEESSLQDVAGRVAYLKAFLHFTDDDGAALNAATPILAPAIPAVLDTIYTNLISFDVTAKAFMPRQPEQDEHDPAAATLEQLSLTHPNILHRKDFLKLYLVKLVSNTDWSAGSKFWEYLDKVGLMHTGEPGFKHRARRPQLRVELMHCSALLGFVEDIVVTAVLGAEEIDLPTKTKVIRAFNKLLWIQNDLFLKHYTPEPWSAQKEAAE
ncbi:hypothetical protein LOZ12_006679 [Ophidiomyces ophidiicola]|uniref:Uncharacterized protein n=1 Tax=Ophidiomyces ophidiicola TaxID=1387563 RepID=A0ACB8UMK0_9EURO|nr:uncharacterized protein LOZ57_002300 [Ophidiomyces ophidiicola]KAI1912274.1 hypothetical protein LOZ61_003436 [Ophidiomyces ophidiicola]KAI1919734.1 hypothetical protein LOZ65_004336 [Ophidiomyces ophidiicola]KAI1920501.1 hypothetical protein LOZ64_001817 [Ophidiomyces ophidiicola]KAI1928086.1 hypothetical protein LOZ60_002579 [Ophidiomyces ophidiicola]KAI1932551.1 hypothetical protein LOZ62_006615 [Ophidiomyces ophidiicola]